MDRLLYTHLMLGPFMLILAFLFKRFPPKQINNWYGYRTPRSMSNPEAWIRANHYSSHALILVSCIVSIGQVIFYSLLTVRYSILWSCLFLAVAVVAVIPLTEIHLKKKGFR